MLMGKDKIDEIDGFNYRLLKHESENGDWYAIHEVYYNDAGKPVLCTAEPVNVQVPPGCPEPKEDVEETLRLMSEALNKTILNYKYFDNS